MQQYPKTVVSGVCAAVCSLLLAGCVGGKAGTREAVDYDHLPASGDHMAEGPGLFSPVQVDGYDDGVRVFSNEPSKPALINLDRPAYAPTRQGTTQATNATNTSAPGTAAQEQEFSEFEAYQRFRNMARDSVEYQRFKDWQQWKRYQQWKDGRDR